MLDIFVKLLVNGFQQNDLIIYSKLSQSYYALLETLTADHISFIAMLEPNIFMYILQTISDGLTSLDSSISTFCSSALDHIVTYLFKMLRSKSSPMSLSAPTKLMQFYQQQPTILQQVLNTVINIIVFEDCRNQWSMSRPLLGLILLNEQYFEQWRNNLIDSSVNCLSIIKSQSQMNPSGPIANPKDSIDNCLKNLMNGIERNLSLKNRDKFTQNIATFRRDLNECLKTSITSGNSTNSQSNAQYIDYMQHQMTQHQQQYQNNQNQQIQNMLSNNLLAASSA